MSADYRVSGGAGYYTLRSERQSITQWAKDRVDLKIYGGAGKVSVQEY